MLVQNVYGFVKNLPNQKNWKIRHCFIASAHGKFSHNNEKILQFSRSSW